MKNLTLKYGKIVLAWTALVCCVVGVFQAVGHVEANNSREAQYEHICVSLQGFRLPFMPEPIMYRITGSGVDTGYVFSMAELISFVPIGNRACFMPPSPLPAGQYTIHFAQDSTTDYLNLIADFNVNSRGYADLDATLIEGDLNGDNMISGSDFSIFMSTYNAKRSICLGDSNYDRRGDLNEDHCIDDLDFDLLKSNYSIFPVRGD